MLHAVHIERYRGIARCAAQGLGRVNLVVGKNEAGKTTFMEAIELADEAENAAHVLLFGQQHRLGRTTRAHDLERFWRPVFFGLDARTGFSISVTREDGARQDIGVRQGTEVNPAPHADHEEEVRRDLDDTRVDHELAPGEPPTWVIDLARIGYDGAPSSQQVIATSRRVKLPRYVRRPGGAWIHGNDAIDDDAIKHMSRLTQQGNERAVTALLRAVDHRVSGVQVLAPGGDVPELFVRSTTTRRHSRCT